MKSMASPNCCCRSREQLQYLGLHRYVQRCGGLVGNQKLRPVRERHGDEDALSLAAGELMRIVRIPFFRLRQGHGFQIRDHCVAHLAPRQRRLVGFNRFCNLPPDGHHRVQRGHRLLKDHRDAPAAITAHCLRSQRQQFFTIEADAAPHLGRALQQAEHRERCNRLTRPRFAHQAQHLARRNCKAQLAHDRLSAKRDCQLFDGKQRLAR